MLKKLFFTRAVRRSTAVRFYSSTLPPREKDEVDLVIVGAGPAGLAAAIRYKQLDKDNQRRVVVIEKAADLGAHSLSGAVLEPRALDELLPNWREENPAEATLVTRDEMRVLFYNGKSTIPLPEPSQLHNKGKNYIVSISQLVRWLGEKAAELDVEVYPGFSVNEVLHDESGKVIGIATEDQGRGKDGKPLPSFERGMEFHAPVTLFAEGCRGSLSQKLIKKFNLREEAKADVQTYGIGIKEVWEVQPEKFEKGRVSHSIGYPLTQGTYGGGFMYHFGNNLVSLGLVVGLDYKNPYLSPYEEFQKMKSHEFYRSVLEGGKCIAYGARALNEGGYQSIPKLTFPGGALIGCSAGFINVPKIKGIHTAMKSGMIAAEHAAKDNLEGYDSALRNSWVGQELWEVRNVRPAFAHLGPKTSLVAGILYAGLETMVLKGKSPWTLHHPHSDSSATQPASNYTPIVYPKHDNKVTFDLLTSVSRTGTYHRDDEPNHLKVADVAAYGAESYNKFKGLEQRFCPAGVYEYLPSNDGGEPQFRINSQNCIHCKTCDIKSNKNEITWTCPEGGDGPKYTIT